MNYIRRHLGAKLLLSYLAIILVGAVVLAFASQFILPAAFNRHMAGMGMMNNVNGMTHAPGASAGVGGQGLSTMSQLYLDFRASFNEALGYAALAAAVIAVALSLYLSRSVTAHVSAMSLASQRIADG